MGHVYNLFIFLVCFAALKMPRYKIVVQAALGQKRKQGARVASRCLWDINTDNYTSYSFENVSIREKHAPGRALGPLLQGYYYLMALYYYTLVIRECTVFDMVYCYGIWMLLRVRYDGSSSGNGVTGSFTSTDNTKKGSVYCFAIYNP